MVSRIEIASTIDSLVRDEVGEASENIPTDFAFVD